MIPFFYRHQWMKSNVHDYDLQHFERINITFLCSVSFRKKKKKKIKSFSSLTILRTFKMSSKENDEWVASYNSKLKFKRHTPI